MLPREKGTDKTTDWKAILTKLRGRNPDAVFYGGMDATGGPLLKQGKRARHQGGVLVRRRRVHRQDEGARRRRRRRPALLAGRHPADGRRQEVPRRVQGEVQPDPILYAPFTYDAANLLIEAMKKANSTDPTKYLPELQKISFKGATGPIAFDDKGDRKDAEITIFTMKGGKIEPDRGGEGRQDA